MQTTVKHEKGIVVYVGIGGSRAVEYRSPFSFRLLRKRELKKTPAAPEPVGGIVPTAGG